MSKCKSCGAEIIWIITDGGKSMPCNVPAVEYWDGHLRDKRIVTIDGRVLSVQLEPPISIDDPAPSGIGWIPHWSTCLYANNHRRNKFNE